jgi:hypothetical protein
MHHQNEHHPMAGCMVPAAATDHPQNVDLSLHRFGWRPPPNQNLSAIYDEIPEPLVMPSSDSISSGLHSLGASAWATQGFDLSLEFSTYPDQYPTPDSIGVFGTAIHDVQHSVGLFDFNVDEVLQTSSIPNSTVTSDSPPGSSSDTPRHAPQQPQRYLDSVAVKAEELRAPSSTRSRRPRASRLAQTSRNTKAILLNPQSVQARNERDYAFWDLTTTQGTSQDDVESGVNNQFCRTPNLKGLVSLPLAIPRWVIPTHLSQTMSPQPPGTLSNPAQPHRLCIHRRLVS